MLGESLCSTVLVEAGDDVELGSPHECSAMTHSALAAIRTSGVELATLIGTDSSLARTLLTPRPRLNDLAAFDDFGGERFGARRSNAARNSVSHVR
jgi:hypothetical protein